MIANNKMQDSLRKAIIRKYMDILSENVTKGNYVDTDFQHYSELVKTLITTIGNSSVSPNQERIFFTGLCLPLFQWFNFDIEPPTESDVTKITKMQCDPIWSGYLNFVREKLKSLDLYRCILLAEDNVKINDEYKLICQSTFDIQSKYKIIYKTNSPLEPLSSDEINLISTKLTINYPCYQSIKMAYLIVGEELSLDRTLKGNGYMIENLKTFFQSQFHRPTFIKKRIFNQSEYDAWIVGKKLAEDLFIIGEGHIENNPNFIFGLCANVIEFKKVRLWFISKNRDAQEKNANGKYEKRFTLTRTINDFVKLVTSRWEDL